MTEYEVVGRTELSNGIREETRLQDITNFVILGTQRTGTTLVRTSLSSHPDILCCGEVFLLGRRPYSKSDGYWSYTRLNVKNRVQALLMPRMTTAAYLNQLYSKKEYAAIGFKLMLGHCLARPYIWPLVVDKDVKVILVRRRNSLKTLVSRRTAAESGVYHISRTLGVTSAVESWDARSVTLDPLTLVEDLDSINSEYDRWRSYLEDTTERLDVEYEDYTEDIVAGNKKVLEFLGMRQVPLKSDLKKVNPDDLSQSIANYDEVVQVLENSRYSGYLDPR